MMRQAPEGRRGGEVVTVVGSQGRRSRSRQQHDQRGDP